MAATGKPAATRNCPVRAAVARVGRLEPERLAQPEVGAFHQLVELAAAGPMVAPRLLVPPIAE